MSCKVLLAILCVIHGAVRAQQNGRGVKVALVKMPYVGERNTAERSGGPDYLEHGGIQGRLEGLGCLTRPVAAVELSPEEQKSYGEWNRLALANGALGRHVAEIRRAGYLPIGLLANCLWRLAKMTQ